MGTVSTTLPSDGQTIDASDVNTPINAILAEFNGNIDNDNIKTAANISGSKLGAATTPLSVLDADGKGGWITGVLAAPNTITNNGNRSYDLVFNTVDYTDELSAGMRLRLTRTVSAPTQCADLESGSSQYFNKTSPNKCTFTDDFNAGAWIKLESYAQGTIISRYNGTSGWLMDVDSSGRVRMIGYNAGAGNFSFVSSTQSIPLNKWVHVAGQLDMSAFTATTTTSFIMIDGVDVPCTVARSGTNPTALVQAGNLEVGSANATNFFDGKLAQVFYTTAKVTQATLKTFMSQTLTGAETSMGSCYSLSNSITDLNTTTPNDLTPQGSAVATSVDSPFGNYLGGTLEYAIITKTAFSTNTTLTVQVPEGCAIPTSGGVSAVAYSTHKAPYGMPVEEDKWTLDMYYAAQLTGSTSTTQSNIAGAVQSFPVGSWEITYETDFSTTGNAGADYRLWISSSTAGNAIRTVFINTVFVTTYGHYQFMRDSMMVNLPSATTYYLVQDATGVITSGTLNTLQIKARLTYL